MLDLRWMDGFSDRTKRLLIPIVSLYCPPLKKNCVGCEDYIQALEREAFLACSYDWRDFNSKPKEYFNRFKDVVGLLKLFDVDVSDFGAEDLRQVYESVIKLRLDDLFNKKAQRIVKESKVGDMGVNSLKRYPDDFGEVVRLEDLEKKR